jgi:protein-disulfide isomerase
MSEFKFTPLRRLWRRSLACIAVSVGLSVSTASQAQFVSGSLSLQDTSSIEKIVEQYLLKNPEIIQRAALLLQERTLREQGEQSTRMLKEKKSALFEDSADMVLGNPKGDVTLVEFFDFRCGYCKRVHSTVKELIAKDKNVRIVLKQLPILGPDSMRAAQAAMAAHQQGKYVEFHNQMFDLEQLDTASILQLVATLGLDPIKFERDIANPVVWGSAISNASKLAADLGINGTPAFVMQGAIIPGAASLAALEQMVANQRELDKVAVK